MNISPSPVSPFFAGKEDKNGQKLSSRSSVSSSIFSSDNYSPDKLTAALNKLNTPSADQKALVFLGQAVSYLSNKLKDTMAGVDTLEKNYNKLYKYTDKVQAYAEEMEKRAKTLKAQNKKLEAEKAALQIQNNELASANSKLRRKTPSPTASTATPYLTESPPMSRRPSSLLRRQATSNAAREAELAQNWQFTDAQRSRSPESFI